MLYMNAKTFNPEILYVFDAESHGPTSGKDHYHDFFEMSIVVEGSVHYLIDGVHHHLDKGAILVFNPGMSHHEWTDEGMYNRQIHIGMRHFTFDRFPRDHVPFDTTILYLSEYEGDFFSTCWEIISERHEAKSSYEILLKSLVLKLLVYLLRDKATDAREDTTLLLNKQQVLVADIIQYIESHYMEDISLNQMAKDLYSSPAMISRIFKDQLDETPINYLIRFRLEKAKDLMEATEDISVKEVARLIGYEDAFYFSKLFKKYYGSSPSRFIK